MLIKRLLVVNDSISNKFKSLVQGKISYWYDTTIPNKKFSFKKVSKIINKQGIHNRINKEYMITKEHIGRLVYTTLLNTIHFYVLVLT